MNLFDIKTIKKCVLPNIEAEKHEAIHTVKQLFKTGVEVTLKYVVRDGKMIILEEQKRMIENISLYKP